MFEAKSFSLKVNFGCLNAVAGQMVIWGKESNPSASFLYLEPLKNSKNLLQLIQKQFGFSLNVCVKLL